MIPDLSCLATKNGCLLSRYDDRYKPLWVRKGTSKATLVQTNIVDIFIGYCLTKTVSSNLVGMEIGSTSGAPNSVTVSSNDIEIQVPKKRLLEKKYINRTSRRSFTVTFDNDSESFDNEETEEIKSINSDWYKKEIIYYAIQPFFRTSTHSKFLDEYGQIDGVRYKILEVQDRDQLYLKLILRELETRRLKTGEHISNQTRD